MKLSETFIKDLYVLEPSVYQDNRGYFFESFNSKTLSDLGIKNNFVQDNQSYSKYGVIRGLHYQLNPNAQSKLVRVLKGKILDVAVDIRKNSATFGQHYSIELSDENHQQLLIPAGFAHGFSVLSKEASVLYKCDHYYHKESEGGIIYNDTDLNINWQIDQKEAIVSDKDSQLPSFENAVNNF